MKKLIVLMMIALAINGLFGSRVSADLNESDYQMIAENFLTYLNSNKTIASTETIKEDETVIGYLMKLEKSGYILIPAMTILPPIKAYSLNNDFETLPPFYKQFLMDELKRSHQIKQSRTAVRDEPDSRWKFLLSFDKARTARKYVPDTFLLKTKWNQPYPYNKKMPQIDGEYTVTGCVQVSQAQIMNYHKHPKKAEGVAIHTWNGETLKAVLYKNYHWENMPDVSDAATPEYMQDELALLMRDLSIVNKATYGIKETSTITSPDGLLRYFGYSTDIQQMSNKDETSFFETVKNEIDNERPVILSFPSHCTVADGYDSDPTGKKFHVNMGWGGHYDDYYYLNETVVAGSHSFKPDLNIFYNIKPCDTKIGDCHSNLGVLEDTDTIDNDLNISGSFNYDDDTDIYEAYLKDNTIIEGERGFLNQAFYITLYNSKNEMVISIDEPFETNLPTDKYTIEIALKGYTYNDKSDYTVNISTEPLTASEYETIDNRDTLPVINNEFKDISLFKDEIYKIRIDAGDEDGDGISITALSSDNDVKVEINEDDILTITPNKKKGHSEITVKASAKDKVVQKTFDVIISDVSFGKEFNVNGTFESQEGFDKHKVVLDGSCTIKGYRGYSNQAFYTSVLDSDGNYLIDMNEQYIESEFQQGVYFIGASLSRYAYEPEGYNNYTLFIDCPDADTDIGTIKKVLDIEEDEFCTISGCIRDAESNGIEGVKLVYGDDNSVTTDSSGAYSISVTNDWSGTVKPTRDGYAFSPSERSYEDVTSNRSEQNYTAETEGDDKLVWQTSKSAAVDLAKAEGKKILLLAGRETCFNCSYMRNTVCESESPPIRDLLMQNFVLWFCDVDASEEWYGYAYGLGEFYLPLICVIDPDDADNYLDRTTNVQYPDEFYSRLSNIISPASFAGDIDHSGAIDLSDAILVLKVLAGIADSNIHIDADVNKDQQIGAAEVIYILQKISELRE